MDAVKVNLGSETTIAPNWINYDISPHIILSKHRSLKKFLYACKLISKEVYEFSFPCTVIRRDIRKGIPLPDSSVGFVYASHFLEHLTQKEAVIVLKESYRVLTPGGYIRIICPDLEVLTARYLAGDLQFFQISERSELAQAFVKTLGLIDTRPFYKRLLLPYNRHCTMYDFSSLKALLQQCGFRNVCRKGFREGVTPDIDKLDNRPDESVFIEAQKGTLKT